MYVTYIILICHFITCFTKIVHIAKHQQCQQSYFSIANFSKNLNVNTCQYQDVSIGDRSYVNLNFSSELCKIVRHLSPRFPLSWKCLGYLGSGQLEVFGVPSGKDPRNVGL